MLLPQPQPATPGEPIASIGCYLAEELVQVEYLLKEISRSDSNLIQEVGQYLNLSGGKKLRPILTLLVARAFGDPDHPAPVEIGAAMEAVHVATLLHDDVIDDGRLRRGQPSVNARWGNNVAILMADYLFASAFDLVTHHLDPEPLRMLCQVTRRMCEGEMFQLDRRNQWLTPEDYLYLITCKTACLFSACTAAGAQHAALGSEAVLQASSFGLDFGLAFQITDDALDYTSIDSELGKPAGLDLASGKQTLPLILALRDANEEDRARIEEILSNGRDPRDIHPILSRYGAIERTIETAREYAMQSITHLEGLTVRNPTAYELLRSLAEYVVHRRY